MKTNLPDFSKARVLVVGDIILDRYLHGDTSRISPEAPVPVVHVSKIEERLGGAANVALNVVALGGKTTLLGVVGDDDDAKSLATNLAKVNIDFHFITAQGLPTIKKMRVIGRNQQLIRLDFEEKFHYDNADFTRFVKVYTELLKQHDIVLLSDYAKGSLTPVKELIAAAKQAKIPVLVDPKSRDLSIYSNATLIKPNLTGFENAVGSARSDEEIANKALKLIHDCHFQAVLVTRGAQGMSLIAQGAKPWHLATKAREVYDVTGAGDTVLAVIGVAMAAGAELTAAIELANLAASLVVRKLGTATVTVSELRRELQRHKHHPEAGILTQAELFEELRALKARGEKVVMTNGCFDILHPGHVIYLEQAKALGDRLIIAVNDDDSVKRLKGPTRPINSLQARMLVLAGLRSVDFVVPFSEDTPARLIAEVSPSVLVKGGDYKVHEIAGSDHVLNHGGEVIIIPFEEGFSTTNMINKITQ